MKINQHQNKSQLYELVRDSESIVRLISEVDDFMREVNPDFCIARQNYQMSIYQNAGALFKNFILRIDQSVDFYASEIQSKGFR